MTWCEMSFSVDLVTLADVQLLIYELSSDCIFVCAQTPRSRSKNRPRTFTFQSPSTPVSSATSPDSIKTKSAQPPTYTSPKSPAPASSPSTSTTTSPSRRDKSIQQQRTEVSPPSSPLSKHQQELKELENRFLPKHTLLFPGSNRALLLQGKLSKLTASGPLLARAGGIRCW